MALTRPLLSQLNTNIIAFSDNMMVINAGNVANRDLGIVFDRSVNSQSNVALFWQESSSSFTFAQTTSSGLNNANIVVELTANVVLGNIILAGNGSAGIFYANGSVFGGGGGGTPGGNSGQLQFNSLGVFAGAAGATFDGTNVSVTGFNVNNSATIGTTLGVTGNISGSGVTLTGSLTASGSGDFDGGLQSTPIGNAAASTGRFTTIDATGTFTGTTVNAATIGNSGATLTGTIQTAAQTNITSVGTLGSLSVTGNITGSIISATNNGAGTNFKVGDDTFLGDINLSNTLSIRGQQDATQAFVVFGNSNTQSLGRSGSGVLTYQGGFLAQGGLQNTPIGNSTASTGTFTTLVVTTTSSLNGTVSTNNILPFGNSNANIGSTSLRFNTVFAKATSAQYADLAEIYAADANYPPGTVVVFGGSKEITVTSTAHDTRVAGVISTNPAYLMNSEVQGLPVALTGRVPCLVQGPINKGEVLVTGFKPGTAQKINSARFQPGCVVGKAIENIANDELKLIEIVVGRF